MKNLFDTYYNLHNYLRAIALLAGMLALLIISGWLLAGPAGIAWFVTVGSFVFISGLRFTPALILRLCRAQLISPRDAPELYEIITHLANKADLKIIPKLYYLPDMMINAFTTGLKESAVIVLSEGMLQRLTTREITGVLAHEISHIRRNDLFVMLLADIMSRMTSIMAFVGYMLIWIYIPLFILTDAEVPWSLLIVLTFAPSLSYLMQLALSRVHEFSADLDAAKLTGDPLGLASALKKIEQYQGGWMDKVLVSSRHMREPVLLRTHPFMHDRVNRLKEYVVHVRSSGYHRSSSKKKDGYLFFSSSGFT